MNYQQCPEWLYVIQSLCSVFIGAGVLLQISILFIRWRSKRADRRKEREAAARRYLDAFNKAKSLLGRNQERFGDDLDHPRSQELLLVMAGHLAMYICLVPSAKEDEYLSHLLRLLNDDYPSIPNISDTPP